MNTMVRLPQICHCCKVMPMVRTNRGKGDTWVCTNCDNFPLLLLPRVIPEGEES